jgi:hypothetical protein
MSNPEAWEQRAETTIRTNFRQHTTDATAKGIEKNERELALSKLIEGTPELPLTTESLRKFCESVWRELGLRSPPYSMAT